MRETCAIVAAGVKRLSRFGLVNAYLVTEDDGLTLIDTMLPRSGKRIVAAAGETPIRRIVLTHAHPDHIGSLDELRAGLPDAEVLIGAQEAPLLDTPPTRTLEADEHVGSLRVVAAPGHTRGQISLFDTRDGTLYCGDAYATVGGVETSARVNPLFPFPTLGTWNRPTALESARRLRALEPARLAPGHGRVVESPLAAMDAAIARAV